MNEAGEEAVLIKVLNAGSEAVETFSTGGGGFTVPLSATCFVVAFVLVNVRLPSLEPTVPFPARRT